MKNKIGQDTDRGENRPCIYRNKTCDKKRWWTPWGLTEDGLGGNREILGIRDGDGTGKKHWREKWNGAAFHCITCWQTTRVSFICVFDFAVLCRRSLMLGGVNMSRVCCRKCVCKELSEWVFVSVLEPDWYYQIPGPKSAFQEDAGIQWLPAHTNGLNILLMFCFLLDLTAQNAIITEQPGGLILAVNISLWQISVPVFLMADKQD